MIKNCHSCKQRFEARRDAKTCSSRCRKQLQRAAGAIANFAHKAADEVRHVEKSIEQSAEMVFSNQEGFAYVSAPPAGSVIAPPVVSAPAPRESSPASDRLEAPKPEAAFRVPVTPAKPAVSPSLLTSVEAVNQDFPETLEDDFSRNVAANLQQTPAKQPVPLPSQRRKTAIASLLISLVVVLLTGFGGTLLVRRSQPEKIATQINIATQDIVIGDALDTNLPAELQDVDSALLVNGDAIVRGGIRVVSGGNFATIAGEQLTANQTISLPNASGTICLDSNNCGFLTEDRLNELAPGLATQSGGGLTEAVTSLNDLTGDLTIANATGSGSTITINNASTSQKGIAQFNASNFTVTSGNVNTVQDISASSSPTFGGLTLNGNLNIGANTIQGTTAVIDFSNFDLSAAGVITNATWQGNTVAVGFGGTGATSFTTNGVLYGNGSSTIGVTAVGTTGQCLVANTGGAPTFSSCAGGGSGVTLQAAYDNGNTITTTTGRDIEITLADVATDTTFEITQVGTADIFRVNDDGTFTDTTPFVIKDNGNVGIGIANPAYNLAVVGNADNALAGSGYFANSSDGTSAASLLVVNAGTTDSASGYLGAFGASYAEGTPLRADRLVLSTNSDPTGISIIASGASQDIRLATNSIERLRVDASGNVGIGTTSPASLLHVSSSTVNAALTLEGLQSAGVGEVVGRRPNGTLAVPTATANGINTLSISGQGYDGSAFATGAQIQFRTDEGWSATGHGMDLQFFTTAAGSTTLTERLRIDSGGNVGIGTTNPQGSLHVVGGSSTIIANRFGGSPEVLLRRAEGSESSPVVTTTSGTALGGLYYQGYDGSNYQAAASIRTVLDGVGSVGDMPGRLEFYTTPDGSATEQVRLTIKNDGNVGIGTTTPTAPLSVKGNAGSTTQAIFVNSDWVNVVSGSQLSLGNGAASGNSYSFIDASTNGGASAGDLVLQRPGSGNVGIGTLAPSSKLHILSDGSSAALAQLRLESSADSSALTIANDSNRLFLRDNSGNPIFSILGSNANVGIGTTSPDSDLHVIGGICVETADTGCSALSGGITVSALGSAGGTAVCRNASNQLSTCSGAGGSDPSVTLQNAYTNSSSPATITTADGKNIRFTLQDTTTDQTFEISQAGSSDILRINDDGTYTDSTPFVVSADGDVGIGVASPAAGLQINGSGKMLTITASGITTTLRSYDGSVGALLSTTSSDKLSLAAGSGSAQHLTIDTTGSIGIGDSTPSFKLDVNGTGRFTAQLQIDTTLRDNRSNTIINQSDASVISNRDLTIGNATYARTLLTGGNVGIGDTSPAALLTVGDGDLFQVAGASGDITTAGDILINGGNIQASGTNALTIGSGTFPSLTVTTDGTGNGEVVLPDSSIDETELNITNAASDEQCLTYEATGTILAWETCAVGDTLQSSYDNDVDGGNATITLNDTDDSIVFALADTAEDNDLIVNIQGTGNTFEVQDGGTAFFSLADARVGTFAGSNAGTFTFTSDLTSGARSTDLITISQANDATNNSTGNLLQLTNLDTGSTAAVLDIANSGTGADISFNTTPVLSIGDTGTLTISDGTNTLLTLVDDGTTATLSANIIDSSTGFRVAGAATSGNYLRGNGTNFVSSALLTSDLSGTIFTLDGDDADTEAITTGNTLLVAGGTNGIDTDVSATDTVTINFDSTEVGTTTWGSGTDFTWTFDSSGSNPTIAFGSGDINVTPAAATDLLNILTGNLKIGDGTPGVALDGEDVYIEGTLEVDGTTRFDDTVALFNLGASGSTAICRNGSNILAACSGSGGTDPSTSLQNAYVNGNTITTTDDDNTITFNLADTTDDEDFIVNIQGTGNTFEVQDGGTAFATFADTGSITFAPTSGDFVINQAAGVNTQIAATAAPTVDLLAVSNTGQGTVTDLVDGIHLTFVQADDVDATDSNAAIRLSVTSNSDDTDNIFGLDIENLAGTSSAQTSQAIRIGNNWDSQLFFNDTSTFIHLANTGAIVIEDTDGNDLLDLADNGTTGNLTVSGDLAVDGGDITSGASVLNIDVADGGDIRLRGGSTTFLEVSDEGTSANFNFTGNLLPTADNQYDLGSTSLRWKTLHTGPGSVVVHNDATNTDKITLGYSGATAQLDVDTAITFNLVNDTATTINFGGAATAINLGASGSSTTYTFGNDATFPLLNTKDVTFTSDLSGGARSTDVLTISQANDATNNSTGNLLQLTNADTGSSAAVLAISQVSGGTGAAITGGTGGGRGIDINDFNTGTSISIDDTTTGTGLYIQSAQITSGSAINLNGGVIGATSFTGDMLLINPDREVSTATTVTDSGNYIDVERLNSVTNAGGTLNITGDLVQLSSLCLQTAGSCTDNSNILELFQDYANATGAVLNVIGDGTGNLATLDATNTSANGISIDVASSSSSQYVLNLTSNNGGTNVLYAAANGNIGIGDATPAATLTVGSGDLFQVAGASGNIQTAGDLAVNGGDITSTATTWNITMPAASGSIFFKDGTNTFLTIADQGTSANFTFNGNILPSSSPTSGTINQTGTSHASASAAGYEKDMGIGGDGFAVIAYAEETSFDLEVFHCSNAACTAGTLQSVDSAVDISWPAMAITQDGFPIIAYYDDTNDDLEVVKCTNATCSTNTKTTLDSTGTVGTEISIYVPDDGIPVITYYDVTNHSLKFIKCGDANCDGTPANTIRVLDGNTGCVLTNCDTDARTGNGSSIVVPSNLDLPIIAYYELDNDTIATTDTRDLKIAQCSDSSCSTGTTDIGHSTGDVGQTTKMTVGPDGMPTIFYYDLTSDAIRSIVCQTEDSCSNAYIHQGTVIESNIVTMPFSGVDWDAARGADGFATLVFGNFNNIAVVKCQDVTCKNKIVASNVSYDEDLVTGQSPSIAISTDGLPIVASPNDVDTGIAVIKCLTQSCTPNSIPSYSGGFSVGTSTNYFNSIYGVSYYGKSFQITSFDLAEEYPTDDLSIGPGDVVKMSTVGNLKLEKSTNPYEPTAMGIITTKPAITLGDWPDVDKARLRAVALAGRTPVKVTSENGPINIGDPLTASSTPGKAMKATQPGMIIGRAMEPLPEGQSEGLVVAYITLDYIDPNTGSPNSNPQSVSYANISISGLTTTDRLKVTTAAEIKDLNLTGRLTISNSDTAGTITVSSGATLGEYKFNNPYESNPQVHLTPKTNLQGITYWVESTTGGFRVHLSNSLGLDAVFNYLIVGSSAPPEE